MKRYLYFLLFLLFPFGSQSQNTQTVTVSAAAPAAVNANASYRGAAGVASIYYYVCARYPAGSVCTNQPAAATKTAGVGSLGGGNSVTVTWNSAGPGTTYYVMRFSKPGFSGSCSSCAVASNISGTSYVDSSNLPPSANFPPSGVSPIQPASGQISLNNLAYPGPALLWNLGGPVPFLLQPPGGTSGKCYGFLDVPPFVTYQNCSGGGGGGVTSIAAGAGLVASPSPITTTGTLRLNCSGFQGATTVAGLPTPAGGCNPTYLVTDGNFADVNPCASSGTGFNTVALLCSYGQYGNPPWSYTSLTYIDRILEAFVAVQSGGADNLTVTANNPGEVAAIVQGNFDGSDAMDISSEGLALNVNSGAFEVAANGDVTISGCASGSYVKADGSGCGTPSGGGITQLTGDGTAGPGSGSQALTLATVNIGPGLCGDSTHVCRIDTNAKGLVTTQAAVAISASGTPGGSDTQIQFNQAGALGGSAAFTVDYTNGLATFAPNGTGVAFTLIGDASSSNILNANINGGGAGSAMSLDSTGDLVAAASVTSANVTSTGPVSAQAGDVSASGALIGGVGGTVPTKLHMTDTAQAHDTVYTGPSSGYNGTVQMPATAPTTGQVLAATTGGAAAVEAWVTPTLPLSGTTGSIGGGLLTIGTCTSGTASVVGSTTGMGVVATPATYPGDGLWWEGYVSTAGTVTVKVCAVATLTPTASAYNVRVIQ